MNMIDRFKAPTPSYWKKIRNVAGTLAVIGTTIATAPVALPAAIITAGGYIAFGGTILSIFAQTAKK